MKVNRLLIPLIAVVCLLGSVGAGANLRLVAGHCAAAASPTAAITARSAARARSRKCRSRFRHCAPDLYAAGTAGGYTV